MENADAATRAINSLRVDMLDLPFAVDAPTGDAVVVLVDEGQRILDRPRALPAVRDDFRTQRLHAAGFVPGAALQDDRLAVRPAVILFFSCLNSSLV
jgi:hypothetical protein